MAKHESETQVQRELRKEKWKEIPQRETIRHLYQRFCETGSTADYARTGRPSMSEKRAEDVSHFVEENPQSSIRKISAELGYSRTSVERTLHSDLHLFPYKLQVTQKLEGEDFSHRVAMCEELLEKIDSDHLFLENLIFSDEATFYLDGLVNRHNCRIWGSSPPQEHLCQSQSSPKVNVWIALSSKALCGPFFFPNPTINGEDYFKMLDEYFVPMLKSQGRAERDFKMAFFQQDGAPPHYAKKVRQFLDLNFPNRWLGRCGPLTWAARSPDLSPLDYFVWGFLKDAVYKRKPTDLHLLKNFIQEESMKISQEIRRNTVNSFSKRLRMCIERNGESVELP
jgi:hypothetical protein